MITMNVLLFCRSVVIHTCDFTTTILHMDLWIVDSTNSNTTSTSFEYIFWNREMREMKFINWKQWMCTSVYNLYSHSVVNDDHEWWLLFTVQCSGTVFFLSFHFISLSIFIFLFEVFIYKTRYRNFNREKNEKKKNPKSE